MRVLVVLFTLFILSACSSTHSSTQSSPYTLAGSGSPAVVFEGSGGGSRTSFSGIFLPIATDTTVFAYDRLGHHQGVSGEFVYTPEPDGRRTSDETVEYLRSLLGEAGLEPPYVLVGHSLGGEYVLTYAKMYPDEVAGLVLVDSRLAGFEAACIANQVGKPGQCHPTEEEIAGYPEPIRAEVSVMRETEAGLPTPQELGNIPITMLVATEPPDSEFSRELQEVWMEEQRRYAGDADNVRYVEAEGASHYIQFDRPRLVISEIRAMLDMVRQNAGL